MLNIKTFKINDTNTRNAALKVIEAVYLHEKNWIRSPERKISMDTLFSRRHSWFLAVVDGNPAGAQRYQLLTIKKAILI